MFIFCALWEAATQARGLPSRVSLNAGRFLFSSPQTREGLSKQSVDLQSPESLAVDQLLYCKELTIGFGNNTLCDCLPCAFVSRSHLTSFILYNKSSTLIPRSCTNLPVYLSIDLFVCLSINRSTTPYLEAQTVIRPVNRKP